MENIKTRFIAACFSLFIIPLFYSQPAIAQGTTAKCLIVSDIHFAPLYGSTDPSLQSKLEKGSFNDWKKYFASSVAQMTLSSILYGKDANYAVLVSGLINMKKTLPHPAFIIIAGDFIWHNATIPDSILKRKTIAFIAQLFKEKYPNTPIIPAMGNNDTYGNDYDIQDPKFLNDFANTWAPNLPKTSGDQLIAQGYYTWQYHNLKLMVINSAPLNYGSNYPQQAGSMLTWVENTLANAGNNNIWIISHIPPGLNGFNVSNFWNPAYTQQFVNSVVKYSSKVKFGVASHTHLNDFKVFYDASKTPQPVAFMRIVPSICSNHSNNPSFEVAEFDKITFQVIKETNHYLNLATVPNNADTTIAWSHILSLPASLKLGQLNATGFSNFINIVKTDKTGQSLSNYIKFYTVGTKIDSAYRVNRSNYLNYLKADSLKGN
jgi:sphingomyelin phosphodiesterase acid-like 3